MMKRFLIVPLALAAALAGGAVRIVQDQCGPFTDVTPTFCPYVLELYYLGITVGTSSTTFSPDDPLTRGQAAVFVARGLNQSLARSSGRAALGQWWTTTPHYDLGLGLTPIPSPDNVYRLASDGKDVWVTGGGSVRRIRQSDGKILQQWTGFVGADAVLVAMGRVFVSAWDGVYMIDPSLDPGSQTHITTGIGSGPIVDLAFDGSHLWATSSGVPGMIGIFTPATSFPWPAVTFTYSQNAAPLGLVHDGTNVWITDFSAPGTMRKFDETGAVLMTVNVGDSPGLPAFDGSNIWVPSYSGVTVVQASTGVVLATHTSLPIANQAAFDGTRILVTTFGDGTVTLFNAADLSLAKKVSVGFAAESVCSDGVNFWLTLAGTGVGRF